jgi:hypothetical protein
MTTQKNISARDACDSLSPRAGRGWGEGAFPPGAELREVSATHPFTRKAQNRGEAPSPSVVEPVIGPATSGRTRWLTRPLPARGER